MAILTKTVIEYVAADLTALKSIDTTGRTSGLMIQVDTMGIFKYSPTSTATPDDRDVVQPTVGGGRWLRQTLSTMLTTASGKIDGSQIYLANLLLPATTSTTGIIKFINPGFGDAYIHTYGGYASPYNNSNFFAGNSAGNFTNTAVWCHGIGNGALVSLTSGQSDDAYGVNALASLNDGNSNSALGPRALSQLKHGSYNLGLGVQAGNSYTDSESSNIAIRNTGVAGESHVLRIGTTGSGNAQQNKAFIAATYGTTTTSSTRQLVVISDGEQLGSASTVPTTIEVYDSVAEGITAHVGGGQASATLLPAKNNFVDTCASDNDSVLLPVAIAGMSRTISNSTAKICDIYPQSGSYLNGILNASFNLGPNSQITLYAIDSTHWRSI